MTLDVGKRMRDHWLATHGPANQRARDQGVSVARKGSVERLEISAGEVTAKVRHGRGRPPRTTLHVPVLTGEEWDTLIAEMSGEVRYTAALLAGELPEDMDALTEATGVSLVPAEGEVTAECTCLEPDQPCVHVAALHAALADQLRDDPLLVLRLRGRDRDGVLDELRSARADGEEPERGLLDGVADPYAARADLDAITVHPTPVEDPSTLFQHLGEPPGVDDTDPFVQVIHRTAGTAWRLASGAGSDVADDELLLAELRGQRVGTAGSVAEALGWDLERTRAALDRLFEDGAVLRTGSDEDARYRAAST